ncbi:RBBP9/YdeN family alpha/beta hydrolase [Arcicella lustrica]|uniref:Alpha/beta hydrolase n=1 Tax=Arcicella lustrica TaxID=2984196 RepID=A0ABU5SH91_9BACT|nr:alpha/beta hydrolase [Arcicella sp. DC25W]MEA5426572.1 alpha/beta hydrolase [Arcicella sp. DC25W]
MITHFLTVPGLGSSGPKHWQTIWEQENPEIFNRVEQEDWDAPEVEKWVETLNESIHQLSTPTLLIAHSLGCLAVVHWAKKYTSTNIAGIILVAPADAESAGFPKEILGFSPIPTGLLPYQTVLIASTNDDYATIERAKHWAESWGSQFVNIGALGHINANSNLADWKVGKGIINSIFSTSL